MSLQRAVVFDLETVPDLMAGRELLHAAPEIPDAHVRRMLGERYARPAEDPDNAFVKVSLQRIVCIGAIYIERTDQDPWTVVRSGVVHVGSRSERELVETFVESLAEAPSPQLVGFNSSSFDLPVLRYRAFALAVPAQAPSRSWVYNATCAIPISQVLSGPRSRDSSRAQDDRADERSQQPKRNWKPHRFCNEADRSRTDENARVSGSRDRRDGEAGWHRTLRASATEQHRHDVRSSQADQ